MDGKAMTGGWPTTPVRGEDDDDYGKLAADEVALEGNLEQLKVHPHGLSANTKLEHEEPDESLDCVKRSQEVQADFSSRESGQKNALDQIDINRMFAKSQDAAGEVEESTIYVKHSPLKFEMSSPAKQSVEKDEEGPQPKRLKLELECVPNLAQPSEYHGGEGADSPIGSPEAIEMIEAKSSPMKEFSQVVYDPDGKDNKDTEGTPRRRTSGLHTLTPVHQSAGESPLEMDGDAGEGVSFQMLTSRNEELVEQIHVLNRKLNNVMTTCDITSYRYKRMETDFASLSADCEAKLKERYEELQAAIEERDKLKERTARLKKRIDDTGDEIEMLNQNQSILQKKYTILMGEAENARNKFEELEVKNTALQEKNHEEIKKSEGLKEQLDEMSASLSQMSEENTNLKNGNDELATQLRATRGELSTKNDEIERLQEQLKDALNAEQGVNAKIAEQVNELVAQRAELESQFGNYKVKSETKREELTERVKEAESRLNSKVDELLELKQRFDLLLEDSNMKTTAIEKLKKDLEEVNDKSEIDKAQVKELQNDKAELERTNACMESSIAELEESLREWQAKFDEQAEKQKLSIELEAIQLKNSNIEAEHLAELEQLHSNLSALQEDLRQNSKIISELRDENDSLRQTKESLETKLDEALQKISTNSDPQLVQPLQKELASWKEKYYAKEQESNKSLKLLAEDLYIQYSSKHEQKVKLLKKGYETKFQGKFDKLTLQNEGLSQEVEQLRVHLASERKEKQKLLDMLESRKSQV